jgi:hypothetical protein
MSHNLVLKVADLHYYVVLEQIVVHLVDPSLDPMCVPLLVIGLEILAPPWTFSGVPTHLKSILA